MTPSTVNSSLTAERDTTNRGPSAQEQKLRDAAGDDPMVNFQFALLQIQRQIAVSAIESDGERTPAGITPHLP